MRLQNSRWPRRAVGRRAVEVTPPRSRGGPRRAARLKSEARLTRIFTGGGLKGSLHPRARSGLFSAFRWDSREADRSSLRPAMTMDASGEVLAGATSSLSKERDTGAPPKPRLRGRLHQAALFIAVPASLRLVGAAPRGSVRLAMIIYALSLVGLFGASAAYHRLYWSPTALRRMRILDHSMIFFLIAGTYTGFGVLVLHGLWRLLVLMVVWTGALVGIALKLVNIDGYSRLAGSLYMALGWIGIAALPQVLSESEPLPLGLTLAGGFMYTAGAVVMLRRRPDPNSLVFGYHEIWHALVVAASTCHYAAIWILLSTAG